jgi:energy-coupling factor transporter ATP-binding protein EcfA2
MFLKSIEYAQFEGTPRLWKLEGCTFGNINLIVGKNATGKSRTLNIINALANLLSSERKLHYISGNYNVDFDNNGQEVNYILHYENLSVIKEELNIDSKSKVKRGMNGIGSIYYTKKDEDIDFQTPPNELATVARRDTIQHPFLEDLYNWGRYVRHYLFGTDLGKSAFAVLKKDKEQAEQQVLNPKDTSLVIGMFLEGQKKYSDKFTEAIIDDMNAIGYSLESIETHTPVSILIDRNFPAEPVGLYVKESDLECMTDQADMSQGMFRALSLIIQIHYSLFTSTASCILIDDIGEGLDFERSSALVKLLIERAKNSSVQLIMATNDRFIMNNVPLEYWLVMQRVGGISKIYSQRNSPQLFEDFKLTGLNNFDFFSSEYYLKGNPQN